MHQPGDHELVDVMRDLPAEALSAQLAGAGVRRRCGQPRPFPVEVGPRAESDQHEAAPLRVGHREL